MPVGSDLPNGSQVAFVDALHAFEINWIEQALVQPPPIAVPSISLCGADDGVGARSAVGLGPLPGNIAVEIEAIFELA